MLSIECLSEHVKKEFWSNVRKLKNGCWEWTGSRHKRGGYGMLHGQRPDGRDCFVKCHHVAWELVNGEISDGLWVLHDCDNPPCCNPTHLFLGTQFDNMADCTAKGRHGLQSHPERAARGEENAAAKLTEEQVRQIRARYVKGKIGCGSTTLAKEFGVSKSAVKRILNRKQWAHVDG